MFLCFMTKCSCFLFSYNTFYFNRYRYSDEEIPKLLSNLSSWVEELNMWQQKVGEVYKSGTEKEGELPTVTYSSEYCLLLVEFFV